MKIWAHRGRISSDLPGNTLRNFEDASRLGLYGIETDVCFSAPNKDGLQEPIIHHLEPKNNDDPIINALSLDDFLTFLKIHPDIFCLLEPKENSEKLIEIMVKKITEYRLEDRVYLTVCQIRIPFLELEASAKLILRARLKNPKIKIHIIATFPFNLPALARKYNPDIISFGWLPESKLSTWFFREFLVNFINLKRQIGQIQNMGVGTIGGIVNDRGGFKYLSNLGVDGIMTDNSIDAIEFTKTKSP